MFRGEGLIFVGGAPRSGTTLIQRILNAHPNIYGGPEFDYIPSIVSLRNTIHKSIDVGRIDIFLNRQDADRAIALFIKELLFAKKEKEAASFISEKTPANILHFTELIEVLPDAKFIFVVRDPRAIVSSMLEVRKKGVVTGFLRDLGSCVRYINKCWECGCTAMISTKKVVLVKYEDIVSRTDETVKEIFISLGLPQTAINLLSSKFEIAKDNKYEDAWYSTAQLRAPIYLSSLETWKSALKPWQVKYIENSIKNNCIRSLYFENNIHSKIYNFAPNIVYITNKIIYLLRRGLEYLFDPSSD